MERGHETARDGDEHVSGEYGNDGRTAADDRGAIVGGSGNRGTGQCEVSTQLAIQRLATELGVGLLYLPSYLPNLNLFERL